MILGRTAEENLRLEQMAGPLAIVAFTQERGPTAVLRGVYDEKDLAAVGRLLRRYALKVTAEQVEVRLRRAGVETLWTASQAATDVEVDAWMIGKREVA